MAGLTSDPTQFINPDQPFMTVPPEEEPQEETRRLVGETVDEDVFTPSLEERAMFSSLLTCGKQAKVVTVLGHQVGIESLNVDDDLRIGLFTKEFLDSTGYATAVKLATCASGIRTVNNRPLYTAMSTDESPESIFQAKVEKLRRWHMSAITEIYREIIDLDVKFGELAIKLGKLKG